MVHLEKLKLPFTEFLVAMVTGKMCVVGKLVLQGIFTLLARCQHLECFPQIFVKIFFLENLTFRQLLHYFFLFG